MNFDFLKKRSSSSSNRHSKGDRSRNESPSAYNHKGIHSSPRSKEDDFHVTQHHSDFYAGGSVSSPNFSFSRSGNPSSLVDSNSNQSKSKKKSRKGSPPVESPADTRIHICSTCGKTFKKGEQMRRHYRLVHLHIRSYKCNGCDLAFGTKQSLEVHEKTRKHQDRRPPS